MTATTVFGVAARIGTPVEIRSGSGRFLGAYAVDDYELDLDGVGIDLDHDRQAVGEIVYSEITREGQLAVVGVLDDDTLSRVEQPIYFSGSYAPEGGRDPLKRSFVVPCARVVGMSLTLSPANSSARPVDWLPGDVRSGPDRYRWSTSTSYDYPLLERAIHYGRGLRRDRAATRIVDRRAAEVVPMGDGAFLVNNELVAVSSRGNARPPGAMRHGPRGRILSVR